MGGYFICNGIERIIRMLIVQRRHYIMGLKRSAYKKRGNNYTETATLLRSACMGWLACAWWLLESAPPWTAWARGCCISAWESWGASCTG